MPKPVRIADIEAIDSNPWPLVVQSAACGDASTVAADEEYAERVFDIMVEQAKRSALKLLREAGRLREVQSLKLYFYNHDITNQEKK
jgi:hypothetical protein